jgi:hypothetical protein
MLKLLRDAAFLDDRSDVLRGLFITYNHPRQTFCTVELQLVQGRAGGFHGQVLLPHQTQLPYNRCSAAPLDCPVAVLRTSSTFQAVLLMYSVLLLKAGC